MQLLFGTKEPDVLLELLQQKEKELAAVTHKYTQLKNKTSFFRRVPGIPFLYYKTSNTRGSIPCHKTEDAV